MNHRPGLQVLYQYLFRLFLLAQPRDMAIYLNKFELYYYYLWLLFSIDWITLHFRWFNRMEWAPSRFNSITYVHTCVRSKLSDCN